MPGDFYPSGGLERGRESDDRGFRPGGVPNGRRGTPGFVGAEDIPGPTYGAAAADSNPN